MDNRQFPERDEDSIHRTGRIGIIIGIILMLGIPAVISSVYDVWPESAAQVITAGSGLLAVFIPTCIAEVFSYTPILGSSAYITFLTGNVMNLKVPVVVNAQIMSDTASGTEEGDAVATIGVAVSSIVTTLIIAGGVLLLVPLRPILTSPTVQTATGSVRRHLFKLREQRLRRLCCQRKAADHDPPALSGVRRQRRVPSGRNGGLCGADLYGPHGTLRRCAL